MSSAFEIFHTIRSQFLRGVVRALRDDGADQTVDLTLHVGQVRSAVPVHYPFGFSSHVPLNGAVTHVMQNGGDPSDLVALPPANPSCARMGGLSEGETVLYDSAGQKLHFRNGRVVAIDATTEMHVAVQGAPVLTVTRTGVQINGTLSVTGETTVQNNVHATGDVTAGSISLEGHVHDKVQPGVGKSGRAV